MKQSPCVEIPSAEEFVYDIINEVDKKNTLQNYQIPIIHIFGYDGLKMEFQEYCGQNNYNEYFLMKSCDHSFLDRRIALSTIMFEWI